MNDQSQSSEEKFLINLSAKVLVKTRPTNALTVLLFNSLTREPIVCITVTNLGRIAFAATVAMVPLPLHGLAYLFYFMNIKSIIRRVSRPMMLGRVGALSDFH